jgi:hypothetical protein
MSCAGVVFIWAETPPAPLFYATQYNLDLYLFQFLFSGGPQAPLFGLRKHRALILEGHRQRHILIGWSYSRKESGSALSELQQ